MGTTKAAIVLTLYSRNYCHLCHEMLAELHALSAGARIEIEVVDVDLTPEFEARYGELVPVLFHGDRELARYRLNSPQISDYLASLRDDSIR